MLRMTQQRRANVAQKLPADCGRGWREHEFCSRRCLAEIFLSNEILSTMRRELSWSHLKALNPKDQSGSDKVCINDCRRPASADFSLNLL
jgi:hypothetical protein